MQVTALMEKYILHWGEMGTRWGVNRTVSQIHALLYLSPEPLNAEQIADLLSVARSNVSTSLKELQSWDLVQVSNILGDRRDLFHTKGDCWQMLLTIVEGRKRREIDPILSMLRQCELEMVDDTETPEAVKDKIREMSRFVGTLVDWYQQVSQLPKGTLVKMMNMGAKIARFIPGLK
ncbi:GbsR/MarR family transcriptional regulator [Saccharospirillum impatiens]|uniref:GbsR/MarR family transcriptional regulator n=1 Tax=Saccharospirillum impatiens TaxID=169438 RepID=UPI00041BFC4E|nr:MarR family transcriptional regulator [Saccharospirillum impatiens]